MKLETNGKKYQVIYADPPWKFRFYGKPDKRSGRAEQHYQVMELNDIKNMNVQDLADEDCSLFLWVIEPMLPEGIEVMKAWGFEYKTVAFTWVKTNKSNGRDYLGMGYWTRTNPEMCLLGTKGHPKRISGDVKQLVFSQRREHSRKPDEIRNRIVKLCGDLPRIELFARNRFDDWDAMGNELSSTIQKLIT